MHLIDPELLDGTASIENVGLGDVGKPEIGQPHGAVFIDGARGTSTESIVCINTTPVIGPATVINKPSLEHGKTRLTPIHSHDFFAPILLYFPKDHASGSEVYELGQHLSTWPDNVETGTVSLLRGQNFALQKHLISKGNDAHVEFHDRSDKSTLWILKGNDISGLVDVPAESTIFNGGIIANVFFSDSYYAPRKVVITAANGYASWIHTYVESTPKCFSIKTNEKADHDRIADNCRWTYLIIE